MSYLNGKFVWFEHRSNDIPKARKFYEPLFNWHTEAMPMGGQRYHMILNANVGVGGYRTTQPAERSQWLTYLSVDDVDTAYRSALAAGAAPLAPPRDYDTVGRGAVITDPSGAEFALWKSGQGDRPDAARVPSGDWCWNELWTPDETRALAFYQRVFGYTQDSMDMGAQGTYYLLKKDGVSRAGLMRSTKPAAPPMWLPYVEVDDCDASADKARSLGGQVVTGPADIPNVGRFAILIDPLGAALGFIHSVPRAT